ESREASPGVSASASQEREASSSIAKRAYAQYNGIVNYHTRNIGQTPAGCLLLRCSNALDDLRVGEAPTNHLVGQAIVDGVGHSARSGRQFVRAVEPDQRIERE